MQGVRRNWQHSPAFKRFLLPSVFAFACLGFILPQSSHRGIWHDRDRTVVCAVQHHLRDCCPWVGWLVTHRAHPHRPAGLFNVCRPHLWLVFANSRWEIAVVFAIYGIFYAIDESQSKASSPTLSQSGAPRRWAPATLSLA